MYSNRVRIITVLNLNSVVLFIDFTIMCTHAEGRTRNTIIYLLWVRLVVLAVNAAVK